MFIFLEGGEVYKILNLSSPIIKIRKAFDKFFYQSIFNKNYCSTKSYIFDNFSYF